METNKPPSVRLLCKLARENRDGACWYDIAQREIAEVCSLQNWDIVRFTGILAVTSPRVSVRRNARITLHYLATGELLDNVMRSIRRSVDVFNASGVILGQKTNAFNAALLGDASAVVLDVHMADLLATPQRLLSAKRTREPLQALIRRVADNVDMSPRDCQAALWQAQVKRRGRKPTGLSVRQEYANLLAHGGAFPNGRAIQQLADACGRVQSRFSFLNSGECDNATD